MLRAYIKKPFFGTGKGNFDRFNGMIPQGVTMHGRIFVSDAQTLVVAGEVIGNVDAAAQILSDSKVEFALVVTGRVIGNITGFDCVLIDGGQVEGSINIKQTVVLKNKARVTGDVVYGDLAIESGSLIEGKMKHYVPSAEPQ